MKAKKAQRKQALSRDLILESAVKLIDERGLQALSMRSLAGELGVEAMSLYNHVSNKDAILDGVFEFLLAEIRIPKPTEDWQRDIEKLATAFRRMLLKHPNSVTIFTERPAMTQASLGYVEAGLAALEPGIKKPVDRLRAFHSIVAFVVGLTAMQTSESKQSVHYETLDNELFPNIVGVAKEISKYSDDAEFKFGLAALLKGLT